MKYLFKSLSVLFVFTLLSCGGGDEKKEKEQVKIGSYKKEETTKAVEKTPATTATIDLSSKGVGPIKNLELPETIDQGLASQGQELFKTKCTACHKVGKKFIGPAPDGVTKRRSPEWIMNMILNPEEMVQKDPIAKQLLIDYNGSPMANQSLTEAEARSILEYFRTLDQ
ncbi:cytochrome c [Altibacter sp.]|uniref:c-type cytochrome n=1 Tax=Altibacter sp. TaxID=2024823 RepID=UPI000C89D8A9|nr:cytochrome c [Altibacter sp.]MAP55087.1 cytochrome C [Altibacter sp.]|tara:strand:+ start:284 stop:790 length:507 start_codon:yes stop_codon:yes gene_type:complete